MGQVQLQLMQQRKSSLKRVRKTGVQKDLFLCPVGRTLKDSEPTYTFKGSTVMMRKPYLVF